MNMTPEVAHALGYSRGLSVFLWSQTAAVEGQDPLVMQADAEAFDKAVDVIEAGLCQEKDAVEKRFDGEKDEGKEA